MVVKSYKAVTELPGLGATSEQRSMLYTRYKFASSFCHGKDVLEVACGAGQGLGYLARVARKVVGGDIDEENIQLATKHYKGIANIELRKIDAHELSFEDKSFDVIILFEAIYYLREPDQFLTECRRILRDRGTLLICMVNKEWSDFNPSPLSTRYFSARELSILLSNHQFEVELYGSFPITTDSFCDVVTSLLRRAATRFHVMPRTMKGKEFLKRIFLGRLSPLPAEVADGMGEYLPPVRVREDSPNGQFKVLYAVGHP